MRFLNSSINVVVPGKLLVDQHAEIFRGVGQLFAFPGCLRLSVVFLGLGDMICSKVELMAVDKVFMLDVLAFITDPQHLTLVWVEFHQPAPFPLLEAIQVILQCDGVFQSADDPEYEGVISEKAEGGCGTIWHVVYVCQEQERAEDSSLWDT